MIAPEFRQCASINLKDPAKKFIEANHGTELFTSLSPALDEVEGIKKELCGAFQYKCDPEQLKKFSELFAKNYQNSMLLNKYFSFGTGNQQIAVKFLWVDGFSQQKIESYSALFDALSSKYNLGVSLARQACYMNLDGDGIKYASKYLQQAAWIFEELKTNVTQLKPGETSPEMTAESLGMLSNLMLAQAQYLFYKMATEKKMKADMLSKIALQISVYFKKAYELSQANRALANFQNKSFSSIMNYHDKYFEASAWLILAIDRFTVAKEQGKDMGMAAGTAARAYQLFASIQPIINMIPAEYGETYKKKFEQSLNMKKMAEDKAKNVFFEIIPSHEKIQIPDCKNFVKLDSSIKDELDKVPIMNETLRYIIPPQVRKMQAELKQMLQNLVDQKYKDVEKSDLEQRAFLGQYHLPQSYYELTSVEDIPAAYWSKIEDFQKKGAISNFTNSLQSIKELGQNCQIMLQDTIKTLDKEEQEDQNLRGTFGVQWGLPASSGLNGPYRQNIQMYQGKIQIAATQDQASETRFQQQKGDLEILLKTKNELLEMMPVSQASTEIAKMPASIAIKNAIDNIENAKQKRDKSLSDCVQDLANLNMVEKLLQVHQGQISKDEVFNESKEHFNQYFKDMQEQEQLIKAANEVIKTTWSDFQNLKKSIQIDPTRQQFFQRIDLSLMCQQDLENMLHQGIEFYTRLVEHLTNLKQNIQDFKMSRNLQMQDQCQRLGAQPPDFSSKGGQNLQNLVQPPVNYDFEMYHPPS